MAVNNLRVIYENVVDKSTTTLLASSVANASTTPVDNLKSDIKSAIWRSGTTTSAILVITLAAAQTVRGLVLPFTNLTGTATIRLRATSGTVALGGTIAAPTVTITGGTTPVDTGNILALPYMTNYYPTGTTASSVESSVKPYARVWLTAAQSTLTATTVTKYVIEITDTNNLDGYLEVSRLILGPTWIPVFNTSFGAEALMKDMSTSTRSEAGDLIVQEAPIYKTLKFELKYMNKSDRQEFNKLVRTIGTKRPVFISIFPENIADYEEEQTYQIYGKFIQLYGVNNFIYSMYSTQVEVEEI